MNRREAKQSASRRDKSAEEKFAEKGRKREGASKRGKLVDWFFDWNEFLWSEDDDTRK